MSGFQMKMGKTSKKKKTYGLHVPLPRGAFSIEEKPDKFEQDDNIRRGNASILLGQHASSSRTKALERERDDVLAKDPTAFGYDSVYDTVQVERETQAQAAQAAKKTEKQKPKYIANLVAQAKIRDVRNDRVNERILLKERAAEDAIYGTKEKFITGAYKAKLVENALWAKEDSRIAALEEAQDVTKQKGVSAMGNFYANLTSKNIAMGSDVAEHATSRYTPGYVAPIEDDKKVEHEDKQKVASIEDKGVASIEDNEVVSTDLLSDKDADSSMFKKRRVETSESETTFVATKADEVVVSKEDKILAARARFLARKK